MKALTQILADIEDSTLEFTGAINAFPDDLFNSRVSENSWSVADIAEHIAILDTMINRILTGKTEVVQRDSEQKLELISKAFLNFEVKYHAPEQIAPKPSAKDKQLLLNEIIKSRKALKKIVTSEDLSLSCLSFIHARFGELTRIEWIYFIIFHTQRHLHQISTIEEVLKNS